MSNSSAFGSDRQAMLAEPLPPRQVQTDPEFLTGPIDAPRDAPILGREREIAEVRAFLDRDDLRLLTLTGLGGIGKSRLAHTVADLVAGDFAHGACLVSLGAVRDAALLPSVIAQTLGIRETGDRPAAERVEDVLRARHLLLVLDTMEHLVDASPWLAHLLARCPRLRMLVTSRVHLRVRGEQRYPVPPLAVPMLTAEARRAGGSAYDLPALAAVPSVRLFIARAQAVRPDFTLTDDVAAAVSDICRRLDGLPLAIELAAARVRDRGVEEIRDRLTDRLDPLDAPESTERTLAGANGWSHDLLEPDERALFQVLSVFAGTFTFDTVETVANPQTGDDPLPVLDLLGALVDHGLVYTVEGAEPAFAMLETVRTFAHDRLVESGEHDRATDRHAACFLALAERAEPELTGPDQAAWLNRLEEVHADLRAAFAHLHAHGDPQHALRMATALWRFGYTRGYLREALERVELALAADTSVGHLRIAALNGAGLLAGSHGRLDLADARLNEALELSRARNDTRGIAVSLNGLGVASAAEGDMPRTVERFDSALRLFRKIHDRRGVAGVLTNLGNLAWDAGDLPLARQRHEEARDLYLAIGERRGLAWSASNIGTLAAQMGDLPGAVDRLADALALYRELGDQTGILLTLEGFSVIATQRGHHRDAAALLSAAAALRDIVGLPITQSDRPRYDADIAAAREPLGDRFDEAWEAGRTLTLDAALAMIREHPAPAPSSRPRPAPAHGLTPRELEVLGQIAAGLTNQEIADRLGISLRTVTSHASHILEKLDLSSRTAVVAWAIRRGLA